MAKRPNMLGTWTWLKHCTPHPGIIPGANLSVSVSALWCLQSGPPTSLDAMENILAGIVESEMGTLEWGNDKAHKCGTEWAHIFLHLTFSNKSTDFCLFGQTALVWEATHLFFFLACLRSFISWDPKLPNFCCWPVVNIHNIHSQIGVCLAHVYSYVNRGTLNRPIRMHGFLQTIPYVFPTSKSHHILQPEGSNCRPPTNFILQSELILSCQPYCVSIYGATNSSLQVIPDSRLNSENYGLGIYTFWG